MSQGFQQGLFSYSDRFDGRSTGQDQQSSSHPLVPVDEAEQTAVYDSNTVGTASNMLSDMFNFPTQLTATELLSNQISASYRIHQRPEVITGGYSGDWFAANRSNLHHDQQQNQMIGLGTDSAAAMQLFLSNPLQNHQRSHSPSPISPSLHQPQGLSLSLSSTLQQFEMAKGDQELRDREGILYLNNHSSLQLQSQAQNMAVVNVLSHSKYARAAQELLEEFCSVGRGQLKGSKAGKQPGSPSNTVGCDRGASTSAEASSKDMPAPLSDADRLEHQRKKTKLLSMLDEVDRRYNNYCEQMQMVVNPFDSVMGFGAAMPYTSLARKTMSRHFRCLKDAIVVQLKKTCVLLGDKDGASSSGLTKGETPRLRVLDQSLRHQRAYHQMGMVEQEAWKPQRGLPERSVNLLRAWLFEHFLHPYPSDADKHMLARQTGLSKNQVSNWFINARVRLWKPMVEDMYHEEFKDIDSEEREKSSEEAQSPTQHQQKQQHIQAHRLEINATKDSITNQSPTSSSINLHHKFPTISDSNVLIETDAMLSDQHLHESPGITPFFPAVGRSGATGDVSLTLGLRQGPASNAPAKNKFSVREFGGL